MGGSPGERVRAVRPAAETAGKTKPNDASREVQGRKDKSTS